MSTIWLIKLFLAHLLTDFVLQPKKWVDDRNKKHFYSGSLYLHTAITALVALLFIGFAYWYYAIIIFFTHTLIDGWKSYQPKNVTYFLYDQALHLLVITACWYAAFYSPADIRQLLETEATNQNFWIPATAFVFLTIPSGIIIGEMTSHWREKLADKEGLGNAGKWIGSLERVLILVFLLQNQYAAIGLLITLKGLLRFNEKDRQEAKTEYVLIGTLISVSFAILTGIIVQHLMQ